MENITRNYGYMDVNSPDWNRSISSDEFMHISGYPLGIIMPVVGYPQIPGNVANPWTYDFPVMMKDAEITISQLFGADDAALNELKRVGKYMVEHGCRAISGNCGYFANFQKELAEYLPVPVAMSSLLQINWIKPLLRKDEKIGVVCADAGSMSAETLRNVGVEDASCCVFEGMTGISQFGAACRCEPGMHPYNPQIFGEEVCELALKLQRENNLGAILLECSDLPPFSHMVARATNLPVFDFTTLHNWLFNGICRKPFQGFY